MKSKKPQAGSKPKSPHRFTMREILLANAKTNTVLNVTTSSAGTGSTQFAFSPVGMRSVSFATTVPAPDVEVDPPHFRWLNNQALNFGSYRVLRAKVIFVGNVGTTSTGQVSMAGYRDVMDSSTSLQTAYVVGPNAKSFDLASSGNKEFSVNVPVDPSWKKVAATLLTTGNTVPLVGNSNTVVPVNSVNDLCFGAFSIQIVGGPASTVIGTIFLDYDVEFKDPICSSVNT